MNVLKHAVEQPFIFATGLAALVHSTWSLGTLFSGSEPDQFTIAWVAWLIPAFLIAFALDVGQIVTSSEIRAGSRSRRKYVTFAVFALATYYLQWVYMVHHMPALELSGGIRESWGDVVALFRDMAIWIIPALLPLSTLLYTLSSDDMSSEQQPEHKPGQVQIEHQPVKIEQPVKEVAQLPEVLPLDVYKAYVECESCGWSKTYDEPDKAERGLRTHKSLHCPSNVVVQNGNGAHHATADKEG
jgi:hypothetical protein